MSVPWETLHKVYWPVLWFCLLLWSINKFGRETFLHRFSVVSIFLLFHSGSHNSPLHSVQSQRFRLPDHFGPPQGPQAAEPSHAISSDPQKIWFILHRRLEVQIWYSSVTVSIDKALKFFKWPSQNLLQKHLDLTIPSVSYLVYSYLVGIGIPFPLANPLQSQML